MKYQLILGATFLAGSILSACDKTPAEIEAEARRAQARADQEINEAQRKAAEESARAQAKADEEAQRARESFIKARDDLRKNARQTLTDLSVKYDELSAQAARETGRRKAELQTALKQIDEKRAAIEKDLSALETTAAHEFEAIRLRLTEELTELKKAIENATAKI